MMVWLMESGEQSLTVTSACAPGSQSAGWKTAIADSVPFGPA
jgi:hypothetical protein